MRDADCVFCGIVAGELPARFLYADDAVVSFLDSAPATRGHALVVPRAHRRDRPPDVGPTDLDVLAARVAETLAPG